jgi:Ca-activated chloride channel homolog
LSFIWIYALSLFVLVPPLVFLYIRVIKRKKKFALRYSSLALVPKIPRNQHRFRRHVPPALGLLAVMVIIFSFSRPTATLVLPFQHGTVILAIDVSGSMSDNDISPTRLKAAQAAAKAFVEKQPPNVLVGIVSFSTEANLVQIPSTNHEDINASIDRLAPQASTAIGDGILTSLNAIFEGVDDKTYQSERKYMQVVPGQPSVGIYAAGAIVLLTDGSSNIGPTPLDAAMKSAERGVRIYTVGMGKAKSSSPYNRAGSVDQLDEEILKLIANKTYGEYFRADNSNQLKNIYQEIGIQLINRPENTDLSPFLSGLAAIVAIIAGLLSMIWTSRFP